MSCETSNRLLTISVYNPCWQCSIPWGCSASDGPLEWTKKLGLFTSVWMPLERPTALYLDRVSVPSLIFFSLSSSCFRDFCRCRGIVRSCLFLRSLPSLNPASWQVSPTPHCWHCCESDLSYQDLPRAPKGEQQHGQFESASIHSLLLHFPWTLFQLWDRMMNRALLRCYTTGGKYPTSDLLFHLSHGLSCNWPWPCTHTSLQSHWEPRAWCSP